MIEEIIIRELNKSESPPYELLLSADPKIELVKEYIARGRVFVSQYENEIVGIYVLIKTRPETLEIVNIAVKESCQGKGIAKKMIADAKIRAKEMGVRSIEIGTGNSSINQLILYQKCGFKITGIDIDFFTRHYENTIIENEIACTDMIRLKFDI